jgi:hypothetical protein
MLTGPGVSTGVLFVSCRALLAIFLMIIRCWLNFGLRRARLLFHSRRREVSRAWGQFSWLVHSSFPPASSQVNDRETAPALGLKPGPPFFRSGFGAEDRKPASDSLPCGWFLNAGPRSAEQSLSRWQAYRQRMLDAKSERMPSPEIGPTADVALANWGLRSIREGEAKVKFITVALGLYLGTCSCSLAQSSAGGASAGTPGAGGGGSTLSNGSTISGTGGSPGPNTANALNKGTTATNLGTPRTDNASSSATQGNAVNTPAANNAIRTLGNTDTGIVKK